MKKELIFNFQVRSEIEDNMRWLFIDFVSGSINFFCLGLSLMKERLVDNLIVSTSNKDFSINLELGKFPSSVQRAILKKSEENFISIELSTDELDYWFHFFLKYFRDGYADVDHIDLEIEKSICKQELFLNLKVEKSLPPVSEEEARRRLGL